MARILSPSSLPILQRYLPAIVTGGNVFVTFPAESQSALRFEWTVINSDGMPYQGNDVLMLALPHHIETYERIPFKSG